VKRLSALLGVVVLAGCGGGGGGGNANDVLSRTAASLGKIRSGDLTLRLVVSPREGTKGRIGFELRGPFAMRRGSLPVARIAYTQIAGARQGTATFLSTGTKAYAVVSGKAYELPASATEQVRQAAAGLGGSGGGLGSFQVESWFDDPRVEGGGEVGGADTDHVTADLDVVAAANGLLELVRELGRDAPRIEGQQADQLRDAVESSSVDVWTGKQDRLLRRLLLKADLGLDVPESLRRALGDVVGAKVEFELSVSNPNEPVRVAPPAHPLPYSALPGG
jgi:hypothetical protein